MRFKKYSTLCFWAIFACSSYLYAQAPNRLYINVAAISAKRDGFSLSPKITVNWNAYEVDSTNEIQNQFSQIGELNYFLVLSDSATGAIVGSGTTKEFSYTFPQKLNYDQKYQIDFRVSPQVQLIRNLAGLKGLPFTFLLKRDRWSNGFTAFWGRIYNFVTHTFWIGFISKGGPFGTIICTIILSLFILTVLNIFAFWNRLFVKIVPSAKIERIFPKNKKVNYYSEIRRLFSFKKYAGQNEFARKILDCFRESNYEKAKDIFSCRENRSIINNVLSKPILRFQKLKKGYKKQYNYMIFEQTQKVFEAVLVAEIEKLKGVLGVASEDQGNRTNKRTFKIFFSLDAFWIIGAIAPMLGLFGTVLGIAGAFGKISFLDAAGGTKIATILAGDIQMALNTTILGLIVGAISIFCYYYFKKQLDSLELEFRGFFSTVMDDIKYQTDHVK